MAKKRTLLTKIKDWGHWLKAFYHSIKDVIRTKHRFVVMDSQTYKEKFAFQLSGINLFITIGISAILLILLNTILIAFTPLREFIPGYANSEMVEQTYRNAAIIDSLERQVSYQEWMIATIQDVLSGKEMPSSEEARKQADSLTTANADVTAYVRSRSDSLLRIYVEKNDSRYQVREQVATKQTAGSETSTAKGLFFSPLQGQVIATFDSQKRHYAVDVAGMTNAPINAIYGGTVIFANFTVETGYVIAVQHPGDIISVYKHCSALLRQEGDVVRVGEPLGYLGNSGQLTTGPHLHFELWMSGKAVDPTQFIIF